MPLNKEISADNLIQNYRLTSIKYRTYTIVLLILSIFARFYVSDLLPEYEDLSATAASADQQIETLDSAIKQARADQTLLTNMSGSEKKITQIINTQTGCSEIKPLLQKNIKTLKSFLQLSDLESSKIKYDEKKILSSINDFLVRDSEIGNSLVDINSISIGNGKKDTNGNLFLPITLSISTDYRSLVKFLENVENKVDLDHPILYVIDSIDYDVVNASDSQEVNVALNAYYFK